jgi:hypothetical protein
MTERRLPEARAAGRDLLAGSGLRTFGGPAAPSARPGPTTGTQRDRCVTESIFRDKPNRSYCRRLVDGVLSAEAVPYREDSTCEDASSVGSWRRSRLAWR